MQTSNENEQINQSPSMLNHLPAQQFVLYRLRQVFVARAAWGIWRPAQSVSDYG